ncbi:hypothetical protein HMPREF9374_0516 [Desmospora sp. 8437]|nr:hypothetical protein HMPREF9374_0516 [Desmospora sp. 8437]
MRRWFIASENHKEFMVFFFITISILIIAGIYIMIYYDQYDE